MKSSEKFIHRGPAPKENTIRILCAKAAGMCEFPGCQERLFFDKQTASTFNHAYICHIVGSSPNGPRGSLELSHPLSDKLDNLMLLCDKHHTLIDNDTEDYPIETLREMKLKHESNIDKACNFLSVPKSLVVTFSSPVHGHDVIIKHSQINSAVLPDRVPMAEYPLDIKVDEISHENQKNKDHWQLQVERLKREINIKLLPAIDQDPQLVCDMFAIAPIPILAKLGELCGNKRSIFLHHNRRIEGTWKWATTLRTVSFTYNIHHLNPEEKNIALAFSLSGAVPIESIKQSLCSINTIYEISAELQGIECIKSQCDLADFVNMYIEVLNKIHYEHPTVDVVHVFTAVPAVVAIELGRQRMRNVHPKLLMYNSLDGNYVNTGIEIGEE